MSLITRCPACATMFRVVPDQLRISQGWVRCGQCEEVFDGNAHLQPTSPLPQPAPVTPTVPSRSPDTVQTTQVSDASETPLAAGEYDWGAVVGVTPSMESEFEQSLQQVHADLDAPEVSPANALQPALEPVEADPVLALRPRDLQEEAAPRSSLDDLELGSAEPLAAQEGGALRYAQAEAPLSTTAADPKLSFLNPPRPQKAHARWKRPAMVVLSLMLLTGLGAQILRHERDRIAAHVVATRPALDALCAVAACEVQPLQRIDAVVIESSTFSKVRGDVFRLSFALKNASPVDVAAPALELTLTDMADQTLVRKVLLPAQYLPDSGADSAKATLLSGRDLGAVVPIQVKTANAAQRVTGYRLLAFYP